MGLRNAVTPPFFGDMRTLFAHTRNCVKGARADDHDSHVSGRRPARSAPDFDHWDGGHDRLGGERQENLRKSLGQAFDPVYNTEVLAENSSNVVVSVGIKTEAVTVNPFTLQFPHGLLRIGNKKLRIAHVDVGGLAIG